MTLRKTTRDQILESIASHSIPSVPRNGLGLVLKDGRRRKVLYDTGGKITKAGELYYAQRGATARPPGNFDLAQRPIRKGRSFLITTLDGTQRAVSMFDPVGKVFKPTVLGRAFYKHKTVRFTMLLPATVDLVRKNGSVYSRHGDYLPSTGCGLGELEVSAALDETQQIAEAMRLTTAWLDAQPNISGQVILLAGYETFRLDRERSVQYNKISWNVTGEPTAILHRPLTAGVPWMYPIPGACPEAGEDTHDDCVPHQLSRYIRIKGKADTAPFTRDELAAELRQASLRLYEDTEDEDLLDCGFTLAAVRVVCESYAIPLHVCWGGAKIDSYTPLNPTFDELAIHVWGNHMFLINDPSEKREIVRQSLNTPQTRDWVLGTVARAPSKAPGFDQWELYNGTLTPGHWYTRNLERTRSDLHSSHVCPRVCKNGLSRLTSLHYNDFHLYSIPREAQVCIQFLQELTKLRPHAIVYRAQSLAGFGQLVFDSLNEVDARRPPTYLERMTVEDRAGSCCEACGDRVSDIQVDHSIQTTCFAWASVMNYNACLV